MDTRSKILQSDDLPRESVTIDVWGVTVWVKTLTAAERMALSDHAGGQPPVEFVAHIVIGCTVDEDGSPVFDIGDASILVNKAGAPLQRLFNVADKLNGFTKAAQNAIEKN